MILYIEHAPDMNDYGRKWKDRRSDIMNEYMAYFKSLNGIMCCLSLFTNIYIYISVLGIVKIFMHNVKQN